MRTPKTFLAVLVSASLALPASAQVRAAASIAGSALPRVSLTAPLSPSAMGTSAAFADPAAAPSYAVAAFAAPSAIPATEGGAAVADLRMKPLAPAQAAPAESVSVRSRWERFWSGSSARRESSDDASVKVAESSSRSSAPLPRPTPRAAHPTATRVAKTAAFLAPAAVAVLVPSVPAFVTHAVPYLGAGGALVGAYLLNRGVHALLNRYVASKGVDRQRVAVIRLVASVALWSGATAGSLILGGAPHSAVTAVFGAGGSILTLGLSDYLNNAIQGVNFLLTRPFSIGARVQVDKEAGIVTNVTATEIVLKKEDGSDVKIRHSVLAGKPIVVFGAYVANPQLRLAIPEKPRLRGALGAVWASLDRRFWLAGTAVAALLAAPAFFPVIAAGWAATIVHFALAGVIAGLVRRAGATLNAVVDNLARENSWRAETTVMAHLGVFAAQWVFGGALAMLQLGVGWKMVSTFFGASLGLTTISIGLASNNFFRSFLHAGEVLLSKSFKVGDHIRFGDFSGLVEDMTLYHVVLKLDDGRYALVPYSTILEATLVVNPPK